MLLPFHLTPASFDRSPQPGAASPEWVHACLHRHVLTRHLVIRVHREGETTVLEGQVPTLRDRKMAGQVARNVLQDQPLDNRLLVLDDLESPLQPPLQWAGRQVPMVAAA